MIRLFTILFFLFTSQVFAQTLKRAEYFFDLDPGKGNGTSLAITQAASINQTFSINTNSLSSGLHTFNLRIVDSNGHWSLAPSRSFFVVAPSADVIATALKRAEYFFDSDPGVGSGHALAITPGATQNNSFAISLASLTIGFHQLAVRYQDNQGHWSVFTNRTFYIVPNASAAPGTVLKKVEYFFDSDPGEGNGKPLTIASGNPENNSFTIPISSLTSGFHQLCVRYQDNQRHWSLFTNRTFYIVPTVAGGLATSIKKAEYFFDTDPGKGNGMSLSITSGSPQNDLFAINISSLTSGFHQLCIRYQDNQGHWSLFTNRTFYVVPTLAGTLATSIKKAEYFFDTDPGTGNGTSYPITPGNPQNDLFAINISSLAPGFHQLCLRMQDNKGRWSTFSKRTFYIVPGTVVVKTLQRFEYFVDTDPGTGLATSLSITPAAQLNQQFAISLSGEPIGNHTLYLRTKDSQGYWSTVVTAPFSILNCTPPTAPVVPPMSQCGTGASLLTASGASGSQIYRWYTDASTTTVLSTGATYTTPSIGANTTYFVSLYDPTTTCESNRTSVTATVVNIPKPILNLTGSLSVCSGNTETLIAPSGFATYSWSNGITGTSTIPVSTSGNYSVIVGDGTCTSPPSDPFVFTVNPSPSKPIVNATGGGTLCGGGSITLSAPAGFTVYSWSSGQTTSSVTLNSPGDFYVRVTDANNCQSVPSDVFSVTTSSPAKPVIVVAGNTTLCNGSTVNLSAPAGFTSYTWSDGSVTQSITASVASSYTVSVSNGTCASPVSDPVNVTVAVVPTQPAIQVAGSTVLCNNSIASLSAPTGYSSYLWSDGETSQQIVVSTAANYSVQVGNAPNCLSVASSQMTITTSSPPSKPIIQVTGSLALCASTSVTLTAPAGFGSYAWSNGSSSQSIVVSLPGSYSVTVSNGSCVSPTSDPAVVTSSLISQRPVIQVSGSLTLCNSSSVTLTAPNGFSSYAWSNGASTQSITVNSANDYFVSVSNGACSSPNSDTVKVIATTLPSQPMVQITGATALCTGSFAALNAPSGFGFYLWSDGETSQQIVVSVAGNYSVQVGNAPNCLSVVSSQMTITTSSPPSKPIVQVTGSLALCTSTSVTLTAPAGFDSYAWSNGSSSQSIVVSLPGSYSVTVSNGSCVSPTSDPAVVTSSLISQRPVIQVSGSLTLCNSSSVTLTAPNGFSSYAWSNGASTQSITVNSANDYFVSVSNGACSSPNSDTVKVIATTPPSQPMVQITGATALCTGSFAALNAPSGFGFYLWSDGETSQQIVVSTAANYSVQVGNAPNCLSVASSQMTITTSSPPSKPIIQVTGSLALCASTSVTLTAPAGFGSYAWSNGSSSQSIVVSLPGSYSVTVSNGSCVSPTSDPAVVTSSLISQRPVIQVSGSLTLCNSSSVTLTAPNGFSSYAWSNGASTQSITVNSANDYFVSVSNGACSSPNSDTVKVIATTPPSQPMVQITGATALCTGSFAALNAPSGFGFYLWSDGETSGEIVVSSTGNYTVQVGNVPNCLSIVSLPVTITATGSPCSTGGNPIDIPPSIGQATIDVAVGNQIVFDLKAVITKGSIGIDFQTLRIVQPLTSGGKASIDNNNELTLDYTGSSFVGKESVSIQVCDSLNNCTERALTIDVIADVIVFNAVSPFPDGINDFFNLKYIDQIDETKSNKVVIVDRWGNEVFSIADYNNMDRVFKGFDNSGKELPSSTYYYRIDFPSGHPTLTGFISLKR